MARCLGSVLPRGRGPGVEEKGRDDRRGPYCVLLRPGTRPKETRARGRGSGMARTAAGVGIGQPIELLRDSQTLTSVNECNGDSSPTIEPGPWTPAMITRAEKDVLGENTRTRHRSFPLQNPILHTVVDSGDGGGYRWLPPNLMSNGRKDSGGNSLNFITASRERALRSRR